ncbi:MAG: acylphosphatase [Betaproteobacteria bacterium]|nr:acylphosphatase [Betaproteobacteria bacterium]
MPTKHLLIHGRVQGVGFREAMRYEAKSLGVTGWVRNRLDGSVEALVQGSAGQIESIIGWARRGPPSAHVTRIKINDGEDCGPFAAFERYPTS